MRQLYLLTRCCMDPTLQRDPTPLGALTHLDPMTDFVHHPKIARLLSICPVHLRPSLPFPLLFKQVRDIQTYFLWDRLFAAKCLRYLRYLWVLTAPKLVLDGPPGAWTE